MMDSSKAETAPEPEEKKANISAGLAYHFSGHLILTAQSTSLTNSELTLGLLTLLPPVLLLTIYFNWK